MRLGIRGQFVAVLIIAAGLPLLAGIFSVNFLGRHYYRSQKGELFQAIAENLSQTLGQAIARENESLAIWVLFSDVSQILATYESPAPGGSAETVARWIQEREATWKDLPPDAPFLLDILRNPLSERLKEYQRRHPLFAEILIAGPRGALVAATNKTSDYWQADEKWWRTTQRLPRGDYWIQGIQFDESARVYSLNIAYPIYNDAEDTPVGAVKAILNVSPLIAWIQPAESRSRPYRHVLMESGNVLAPVKDVYRRSPFRERVRTGVVAKLREADKGWRVLHLLRKGRELVGYATLQLPTRPMESEQAGSLDPLFVIVHDGYLQVMAPVWTQLALTSCVGGGALVLFLLAGWYVGNRRIVRPLRLLSETARSIAATAHLEDRQSDAASSPSVMSRKQPRELVRDLASIRSVQEMEQFSHDFGLMANRVLNYHRHLEKEISLKEEEIQRDLEMARDFQESLLPREYPLVPSEPVPPAPLALDFFHIYKPAFLVGGDFFDVTKLSDHKAGIFLADVVGHGARSALVTAILRTLLQDLSPEADSPDRFLTAMNGHFYNLVPHRDQCIFATALYLVVDTEERTVTVTSAGHHSPLLVDRTSRTVSRVLSRAQTEPALGLFADTEYHSHCQPIETGQTLLLFTDGLLEATEPTGREEFGWERVEATVREHLQENGAKLCQALIGDLTEFVNDTQFSDDICLVATDLTAERRGEGPLE